MTRSAGRARCGQAGPLAKEGVTAAEYRNARSQVGAVVAERRRAGAGLRHPIRRQHHRIMSTAGAAIRVQFGLDINGSSAGRSATQAGAKAFQRPTTGRNRSPGRYRFMETWLTRR